MSYRGESGGSGSSVKTSSTAPAIQLASSARQSQLVDQPAARDVDQPGALAHGAQLVGADHAGRLVGQRGRHHHDVAGAQHLLELVVAEELDVRLRGAAVGMAPGGQDGSAEGSSRRATSEPMLP